MAPILPKRKGVRNFRMPFFVSGGGAVLSSLCRAVAFRRTARQRAAGSGRCRAACFFAGWGRAVVSVTCASPEFVGRPRRRELRDRPNAFLRGAGAGDGKSAVARERSGSGGSEVASRPAAPYVRLPPVHRSAARALSRWAWAFRGRCPADFGFGPARRSAYVAHGSVLSFGDSGGPNAGRSGRDDRRKKVVRRNGRPIVSIGFGRLLCGRLRAVWFHTDPARFAAPPFFGTKREGWLPGVFPVSLRFRCTEPVERWSGVCRGAGNADRRMGPKSCVGPTVGRQSKADTGEPYRSVPGRDSDGLSGGEGEDSAGNPEAAGVGIAFRGMPFPLPEFAMG